jgi:hypothetical protein
MKEKSEVHAAAMMPALIARPAASAPKMGAMLPRAKRMSSRTAA